MSENNAEKRDSKVTLSARSEIEITDVLSVVSFDEETILLETGAGRLEIDGEGLHITTLSLEEGLVRALGKINGLIYLNGEKPRRVGLFGRKE